MAEVHEVVDFSGGITNVTYDAPPNKVAVADNLLLSYQGDTAKFVLRPGSDYYNTAQASARIPEGSQRISALILSKGVLLTITGNKAHYFTASKLLTQIISTKFFLANANTTFNYGRSGDLHFIADDAYDQPSRAYASSDGSSFVVTTAGLPRPVTGGVTASVGGALNYLFKVVYRRNLSADDTTRILASTPSPIISALNTTASCTLSNLPLNYVNSDTDWPTTYDSLGYAYMEVYRTTHNGTVFYYDGSATTSSYLSTVTDSVLQTRARLYTEGGVLGNDAPPRARVIHAVQDICYYGNVKTQDSPARYSRNRLYQSVPGILDGVPATNFIDLDDDIEGISSTGSTIIVMCSNSVYRIDGNFDSLGRGGMVAQRISDTASCISAQSVVQTVEGVFWAGVDGIYYSNGLIVQRINEEYNPTWQVWVDTAQPNTLRRQRIQGKFDRINQRIWWSVQDNSPRPVGEAIDNNLFYILDLRPGVGRNSAFTTASKGATSTGQNFGTCAIEFVPLTGEMIRADHIGFVYIHKDLLTSDRVFASSNNGNYSTNQKIGIEYRLETTDNDYGSAAQIKYAPRISVVTAPHTSKPTSPTYMEIVSINDGGKKIASLDEFASTPVYSASGELVSEVGKWRHFPRGNLRFLYKRLRFKPAQRRILSLGVVQPNLVTCSNVNTAAGMVGLVSAPLSWSTTNLQEAFIYLSNEGYLIPHQIWFVQAGAIYVRDLITTGVDVDWYIEGYVQDTVFNMRQYAVHYQTLGNALEAFAPAENG